MNTSQQIRFSPFVLAVVGFWIRMLLKVSFFRVCIASDFSIPRNKTVVVVANHMSWWDGFLIYMVRRHMRVTTPIYTIMLEDELKKHRWMRFIGCVGIRRGNPKSTLATFRAIAEACARTPGSWVLVFPQGRIRASWNRPLGFDRGIERLCTLLGEYVVLPVALHIEPLARRRPSAFILATLHDRRCSTEAIEHARASDLQRLVTQRLDWLQDCIRRFGEDIAVRWPSIEPLLRIGHRRFQVDLIDANSEATMTACRTRGKSGEIAGSTKSLGEA